MMYAIYAVYDRVAETYGAPFTMLEKTAHRQFHWMAAESEAKDVQDKVVRKVGYWYNETGEIAPCDPETVADLEALKDGN